jgi:hypothetical protein
MVPPELAGTQVCYYQWGCKKVEGYNKFNLWRVNSTLEQLVKEIENQTQKIKEHIYTASCMWDTYQKDCNSLCPEIDVLTVEDYQMNVEVTHTEMTTSMVFGGNTTNVACYPIGVKFRRPTSGDVAETPPLETGCIVFLSSDLKHDHSQVSDFEKKMFDIFLEEGLSPQNWKRYSDGCPGQYKSKFVVWDLLMAPQILSKPLKHITYNFFESHEGKNLSDTIGSIAKTAFSRATWRTNAGLDTIEDVKNRMEDGLNRVDGKVGKFAFFRICVAPPIVRNQSRPSIEIKGILKVHSLRRRPGPARGK